MRLSHEIISLKLKHTFRTSRESSESRRNVICRLRHDDLEGLGEAAPSVYYGQDADSVVRALQGMAGQLGTDPLALETTEAEMIHLFPQEASARAAVDMALHDMVGKMLNLPLYRILGLDPQRTPQTSVTVGIDSIERMQEKTRELGEIPVLKVKLGTPQDVQIVEAIRQVSQAVIRVDANAAWSPPEALEKITRLKEYDIQFVEQPVAADDLDGLRWLKRRVDVPIVLDESVRTSADIPNLASCGHGINIKLMKCGGLREALRMIHVARSMDLKVMLGCMVETSLAVTAAAHLSPLVDYADLDGHLLIANDPYVGVDVVDGKLVLPDRPGLGIMPHSGVEEV